MRPYIAVCTLLLICAGCNVHYFDNNEKLNMAIFNSSSGHGMAQEIEKIECFYFPQGKSVRAFYKFKQATPFLIINKKIIIREIMEAFWKSSMKSVQTPNTDGMALRMYLKSGEVANFYCYLSYGHIRAVTPLLSGDVATKEAGDLDAFFQKNFKEYLLHAAATE